MAATITIATENLEKTHLPQAQGFYRQAQELYKRPLTVTTANLAAELDTEAKRFIDTAEAKRTELKKPILEAGRKLDAFWQTMEGPAVEARRVCRDIVSRFQIFERQRADNERRRVEKKALEDAEAQRKADADALLAQAAATNDESLVEEAIKVEASPLTPVVVATPEPPKVAGMTVRMKKVGTVKDNRKVLEFLLQADRQDMINQLLPNGSQPTWLSDAIDKRGLSFPAEAVAVSEVAITTNRNVR